MESLHRNQKMIYPCTASQKNGASISHCIGVMNTAGASNSQQTVAPFWQQCRIANPEKCLIQLRSADALQLNRLRSSGLAQTTWILSAIKSLSATGLATNSASNLTSNAKEQAMSGMPGHVSATSWRNLVWLTLQWNIVRNLTELMIPASGANASHHRREKLSSNVHLITIEKHYAHLVLPSESRKLTSTYIAHTLLY